MVSNYSIFEQKKAKKIGDYLPGVIAGVKSTIKN
jgi:hypothetical protein